MFQDLRCCVFAVTISITVLAIQCSSTDPAATTQTLEATKLNADTKKMVDKPAGIPRTETGLMLPDGTRVAILNGAEGAPRMSWPEQRPWSPIIRKETDAAGMDWYVHDDGSKSTTQFVDDGKNGKLAITTVFNPIDK